MGLDIYFYRVKREAVNNMTSTREVFNLINEGIDCAYFRKANFIYAYFDYLIDSDTECCIVDRDEIESLFDACGLVLERRNEEGFAEQVLPTRAGFFFGSTYYDEWYYNKVQSCYEQMKIILDEWQDGDAIVIWFSW